MHGAGGCHQHRKEAVEFGRRQQHRFVAGDVGLGGQGIHGLGAADPGQQLQGQSRHPRQGEAIDQGAVGIGIEQTDQQTAGAEALEAALPTIGLNQRALDSQHHIGLVPWVDGLGGNDLRPGVRKRSIIEARRLARPGFQGNFTASSREPTHRFRSGGHPILSGSTLGGDEQPDQRFLPIQRSPSWSFSPLNASRS